MSTNWKVPVAADVNKVLSIMVQARSNENVNEDATADTPLDPSYTDRKTALLDQTVQEFRGAMIAGGRIPRSQTEGSVPPDAEIHVLAMTAFRLVNSMPNLQMVLLTNGGVYAPLMQMYKDAQAMLKQIRDGMPYTRPTDPETTAGEVPDTGGADTIDGEYDMVVSP
jgi:hypothetical protein